MNTDPDEVYKIVNEQMRDKQIDTSAPLGFNNTYVMSVTPETAERFGLSKLSDLLENADSLRLGCTVEFSQREDSLPKMEQEYGIHFNSVKGLEGSIRYQAITSGEVDITDAFSTDAQLKKMQLVTLEDDLQFFPPYYAVNLTRMDTLEKYPELEPLLSKLDGLISEEKMMEMNYMVDIDGANSKDVAHNFLMGIGLIP
ncbi:Glycine betaine/carnitine/choline-binding protein OpuCC [bioreactor metagenome]|uniref:Glycine betaine/carnitine/choline-binding protein OpuCC n=1 Tax=bioreactor metagenome TaxID=1076179 RepID=A0A644ZYK8_9ZZZZ